MLAAQPTWLDGLLAMSGDGNVSDPAGRRLERATTRDPRLELESLYRELEAPLTNVVYRWVWSREDARDIVQESFLRLWRMGERVDWERARPLVYRTALNLAANRRRWRRLRHFVGLGDEIDHAPGPDRELETAEREAAVRAAIDGLGDKHRRVLVLAVFSDLSYAEIAAVLGISAGTVASRKHNAVARLRAALQGDEL